MTKRLYEWMYRFNRFHGFVRIFFYFLLETKHWGLKKSVRIREIGEIRTSIRITTESSWV
jgi:hypothetical protein